MEPMRSGNSIKIFNFLLAVVGMPLVSAVTTPSSSSDRARIEIKQIAVFDEPLVPLGRQPSWEESEALISALGIYRSKGNSEETGPLIEYLQAYPQSPWRASVLANLGMVYRRSGYSSRALDSLEQAWMLAKDDNSIEGRAVGDRSACELADLCSRLGHLERLRQLLAEVQDRQFRGPASERIYSLKTDLWL